MKFAKTLLISFFIALLFIGCASTTAPKSIKAKGPSYSGNNLTSGVLGKPTKLGVPIDPAKRAEYNSLIAEYGDHFKPALKTDDGVTVSSGIIYLDDQHFVDLAVMISWQRSARHPKDASTITPPATIP